MALLNTSTGELLPGRCKATNLCRYCQRLYVVETVEMLTLDAIEYAPTIWVVLTAREHLTRRDTYGHLRQLRKATRRRWSAIEWFVQVEFQRRGALHLNLLVKGVPVDDVDELRELLSERWCARVDAEPVGQWAGVVEDGTGVVRYLSKMLAHGLKAEQAPPIGWRGHRTSQTRGYLVRPASVMREEARRALRVKRHIWRGLDATTAELEVAAAEQVEWKLRHVKPGTIADLRLPGGAPSAPAGASGPPGPPGGPDRAGGGSGPEFGSERNPKFDVGDRRVPEAERPREVDNGVVGGLCEHEMRNRPWCAQKQRLTG